MIQIILTSKPTYNGYGIEAGLHDGCRHWDHHGEYKNNPCPANNKKIMPIIDRDAFIEITHVDTDTLFGLYRLLGLEIPKINLEDVELIDNNGPSVVHPLNKTLMYMKGISKTASELSLYCNEERKDVTSMILDMHNLSEQHYIIKGCLSAVEDEEYYRREALYKRDDTAAIYIIGKDKNIDTGRPYEDGVTHMILYIEEKGSISIFRTPDLSTKFNDQEWNGILFKGHAGACGSPRGIKYSKEDAIGVFNEVNKYLKFWGY